MYPTLVVHRMTYVTAYLLTTYGVKINTKQVVNVLWDTLYNNKPACVSERLGDYQRTSPYTLNCINLPLKNSHIFLHSHFATENNKRFLVSDFVASLVDYFLEVCIFRKLSLTTQNDATGLFEP